MKAKLSKLLITGLIALSIVGATPVLAVAAEATVERVEEPVITERADKYEYHYREVNGVLQYRIWNRTRGYWMNEWTNVFP